MKVFPLLITVTFFVLYIPGTYAQQQELPPPPNQKEANEQYKKAQQLFEQYRLSRPISEETAIEIIEFYSTIDPDIAREMTSMKRENPKSYQDRLHHMEKEMRFLSRLQEEEPERFEEAMALRKMEVQCNKLAVQYRKSKDNTEKSKLEQEIRDKLIKLFEMKEQEKKLEIERIRERLEKMRQELKERKANKNNIVELRLNELIGKEHLSRW
jgi:hypothetical protein